MADLRFEWDAKKSIQNRLKHGVTFTEAETVFVDDSAVLRDDPDHSREEDRFLLIGVSGRLRVVVVSHCYRSEDGVIRIISARRANRNERTQYEGRWK